MAAESRRDYIRSQLVEKKKVRISELSKQCGVTEETIRKDFDKLAQEGFLIRVHGGAILVQQPEPVSEARGYEIDGSRFRIRQDVQREAKKKIAQKAVSFLGNIRTMFVDSSTTAAEVITALPEEMELSIVTNSTHYFGEYYNQNFQIISTGGEFNSKYLCLQGPIAKETIQKYSVEAALISCKAIDPENGIQDTYDEEADLKKLMIERSKKVILLADHSKFGQTAFVKLLDLDAVDCIITDCDPGEKWKQICEDNNIKLYF